MVCKLAKLLPAAHMLLRTYKYSWKCWKVACLWGHIVKSVGRDILLLGDSLPVNLKENTVNLWGVFPYLSKLCFTCEKGHLTQSDLNEWNRRWLVICDSRIISHIQERHFSSTSRFSTRLGKISLPLDTEAIIRMYECYQYLYNSVSLDLQGPLTWFLFDNTRTDPIFAAFCGHQCGRNRSYWPLFGTDGALFRLFLKVSRRAVPFFTVEHSSSVQKTRDGQPG